MTEAPKNENRTSETFGCSFADRHGRSCGADPALWLYTVSALIQKPFTPGQGPSVSVVFYVF